MKAEESSYMGLFNIFAFATTRITFAEGCVSYSDSAAAENDTRNQS
jgi:hypothetical protein